MNGGHEACGPDRNDRDAARDGARRRGDRPCERGLGGKAEVDRHRLAKRAERVVEKRNRIELRRVSRCGPRAAAGRTPRRWICEWRAEGIWPGEVPYHCAGRAV